MTLADVVGAAGLTLWAELALVVFFVAFVAIVAFLVVTRRSSRWEHLRRLPLEEEGVHAKDELGRGASRPAAGQEAHRHD